MMTGRGFSACDAPVGLGRKNRARTLFTTQGWKLLEPRVEDEVIEERSAGSVS